MLERALGEDKSTDIISRILEGSDTSGIEGLKWIDSPSVAELIKGEHPQIIATILVHLDRDQASEILGQLTEQLRNDVLLRIATLEGIQPYALRELNDVLTDLLSGSENINKSPVRGHPHGSRNHQFHGQRSRDFRARQSTRIRRGLAQKIMDQMIVFENLMDIDDRGIQLLLREIRFGLARHRAERRGRGTCAKKYSKTCRAGPPKSLREDLEAMGPVRVSEVEAQQKQILQIVRRLSDEGQIVFGGKKKAISSSLWDLKNRSEKVTGAAVDHLKAQYLTWAPLSLPRLAAQIR